MMDCQLDTIVNDVRMVLDENLPDMSGLAGFTDQDNITMLIKSVLGDAIKHIYLVADEQFLEPGSIEGKASDSDVKRMEGGKVRWIDVTLNKDTLRVLSATATGWKVPVTDFIAQSDSRYPMLFNAYATGTQSRPKAALIPGNPMTVQLFGCTTNAEGDVAYQVSAVCQPSVVNDIISIASGCYRGVVYYTAGLVLLSQREEHADNLMQMGLSEVGAGSSQ